MASGTITLNSYASDSVPYIHYQALWTLTTNTSANTSTLKMEYQVSTGSVSVITTSNYEARLQFWDADADEFMPQAGYVLTTSPLTVSVNWVTIGTETFTFQHDKYGKLPNITADLVIVGLDDGTYGQSDSYGITFPFETIIRKATITAAPNFKDTDNPTITYTNPMGSVVTALEAAIYDPNGNTAYASYRNISKTGTSYTFNLTTTERNKLIAAAGSSTTLSVRFYIRTTVNGSPYLSSLNRTMTIIADGPTITASIEDVQTGTKYVTGGGLKFIPGNNSMQYTMTATGQKGATIKSYSVICGSKTSNTASGTLTNIENNVVIFSATDSRGITSHKTITLEAVPYIKPTCNQKVRMILKSDTEAQISLEVSGNYFNDSFGAQNNFLQVYSRYKRNNEEYTEWAEITPLVEIYGNTYSINAEMSGFDPSGTYTFQCGVVDYLNEAYSDEYPVQFIPVFDWSKDDFNFNVPVTIEGNPLNDYVIEYGTEAMGSNGTWYWSKWKSGRAECYGCRNYGAMSISHPWGSLYRSEAFTQSLPSGLFVNTPEVIDIAFRGANFGGWVIQHEQAAATASATGAFCLVRPADATLSTSNIGFNVIGRWK